MVYNVGCLWSFNNAHQERSDRQKAAGKITFKDHLNVITKLTRLQVKLSRFDLAAMQLPQVCADHCHHAMTTANMTQLLTSIVLTLTPVLALPPGLPTDKKLASPSFWPREYNPFTKRQACVETCGKVCYWQDDIDAAVSKGYSLHQSGQTLGSDKYPHQYNDNEGFKFPVDGPWYEFPILSSFQVYTGGSPGADRVIFNGGGDYAGVITHTGASGDYFVACAGTNP